MDEEQLRKPLPPEEVERLKGKYPDTFNALHGFIPDDLIAKGCIALEGESQDHLFMIAIYHTVLSTIAENLTESQIASMVKSAPMEDIFVGPKKKNEA